VIDDVESTGLARIDAQRADLADRDRPARGHIDGGVGQADLGKIVHP